IALYDADLRFFFQAEDGIRDPLVTGVQTCALPIYVGDERVVLVASGRDQALEEPLDGTAAVPAHDARRDFVADGVGQHRGVSGRSEERRVGKECRSPWSKEHDRNATQARPGSLLEW